MSRRARRGQQQAAVRAELHTPVLCLTGGAGCGEGGEDSPDVVCPSLPRLHWEVKRTGTCQLFSPAQVAEWDAQAQRDCGTKHPVIAHRWNGSRQWWVRTLSTAYGPYWRSLPDFLNDVSRWTNLHL